MTLRTIRCSVFEENKKKSRTKSVGLHQKRIKCRVGKCEAGLLRVRRVTNVEAKKKVFTTILGGLEYQSVNHPILFLNTST